MPSFIRIYLYGVLAAICFGIAAQSALVAIGTVLTIAALEEIINPTKENNDEYK